MPKYFFPRFSGIFWGTDFPMNDDSVLHIDLVNLIDGDEDVNEHEEEI